ncbi:MAG: hypothetical protein AAGF12_08135 [Myxococcota bacterium]
MMRHLAGRTAVLLVGVAACSDDPPADARPFFAECVDLPTTEGSCQTSADCDGRACRFAGGEARATLQCGPPGEDRVPCKGPEDCAAGLCALGGRCVEACVPEACGAGERCASVVVRTADEAAPGSALLRVRGCVPSDNSGRIEAEELAIVDGRGVLNRPEGLFFLTPRCPAAVVATRLETQRDPPEVLFGAGMPRNPLVADGRPLAVWIPNNPSFLPAAEGYRLGIEGTAEPLELLYVPPGTDGGQLDIDLYYVGAFGWTPADAGDPPPVTAALLGLENRLAPASISLGNVRRHHVTGSFRERLSIVADEERADAFREFGALTAGELSPSVSVFLIRSLDGVVGLSGGIPGVFGRTGTSGSAVVISVGQLSAAGFDRALSHEVGHYLGLFHTSEPDGALLEAIADTPHCPPAQDRDADGVVSSEECEGFGESNLMFWSADGDTLSDGQLSVLSRAPILQR